MKKIILTFSIIISIILIIDTILYFNLREDITTYGLQQIDFKEADTLLENGTGALLICEESNEYCKYYSSLLNKANEENITSSIYYLDINSLSESNKNKLTNMLSVNLLLDENNLPIITIPSLTVVKDGIIVGYNNLSSNETKSAKDFWTNERKINFIKSIKSLLNKLNDKEYTYR